VIRGTQLWKRNETIPFLAIVLLAFAFPPCQEAMKKDAAVKPADPELKVVLDSWNDMAAS